MAASDAASGDDTTQRRVLELVVRLGLLLVLAAWCFQIVRPFLTPVIWGVIIAVALDPAYERLLAALGGRRRQSAVLLTVGCLLALLVPTAMLSNTLFEGVRTLAHGLTQGTLSIPPPPKGVAGWPFVGPRLAAAWSLASTNLEEALRSVAPHLTGIGAWMLRGAAGAVLATLQFAVAIVIAGVLWVNTRSANRAALALGGRVAGQQGAGFVHLAVGTVRSVARGIVGVALIQATLAGLGFLAVGVPAAGLLALVCLLLCVMQIGLLPILIPVVIYVFTRDSTPVAVAFLIWSVFVGLIDNVLKPILLGRGAQVPMLVVFVGAIGGFLSSGILGLFIGAVVLALGYQLFVAWLSEGAEPPQDAVAADASQ